MLVNAMGIVCVCVIILGTQLTCHPQPTCSECLSSPGCAWCKQKVRAVIQRLLSEVLRNWMYDLIQAKCGAHLSLLTHPTLPVLLFLCPRNYHKVFFQSVVVSPVITFTDPHTHTHALSPPLSLTHTPLTTPSAGPIVWVMQNAGLLGAWSWAPGHLLPNLEWPCQTQAYEQVIMVQLMVQTTNGTQSEH